MAYKMWVTRLGAGCELVILIEASIHGLPVETSCIQTRNVSNMHTYSYDPL